MAGAGTVEGSTVVADNTNGGEGWGDLDNGCSAFQTNSVSMAIHSSSVDWYVLALQISSSTSVSVQIVAAMELSSLAIWSRFILSWARIEGTVTL